jgi:hypothetical protein
LYSEYTIHELNRGIFPLKIKPSHAVQGTGGASRSALIEGGGWGAGVQVDKTHMRYDALACSSAFLCPWVLAQALI